MDALLLLAVLAASPFAVHYGAEARLYALALALAVGLLVVEVSWLERPASWHPGALAVLLLALSLTISTWPIAALAALLLAGHRGDSTGWRAGSEARLPPMTAAPGVAGYKLEGPATGTVWVAWPDGYAFVASAGWVACSRTIVGGSWRLGCWHLPI